MAFISKIQLPNEQNPRDLRDAASMHYLGHTTTEIVPTGETSPTGATITIGGVSVTAVANDYVTSGDDNLNYIFNGTTWDALSEAAAEESVQDVTVNGTSVLNTSTHTAEVVINAATVEIDSTTDANNVLADGVKAVTQSAGDNSQKLATTAYVETAIDNIPSPMRFVGTLGASGTGDIQALPVDGTAKVGDTYKVVTAGTYATDASTGTQDAKVGDLFICKTKTASVNTWDYVPSGDDIDVTSVGAEGGLKTILPSGTGAITSTGSIALDLTGNTALADTASAPTTTADSGRVFALALDAAGHPAVNVTPGALEDVVDGADTTTAVTGLSNTTSQGASSVNTGHVGTTTGVDDETLYLDTIFFTSDNTVVNYTEPTP